MIRRMSRATIDFAGPGDHVVVAGAPTLPTRVWKIFFVVSSATTVKFKDGVIDLTGSITLFAGGTFVLDFDDDPWFSGTPGSDFIISQTGTAQVSGQVSYTQT